MHSEIRRLEKELVLRERKKASLDDDLKTRESQANSRSKSSLQDKRSPKFRSLSVDTG